MKEYVVAIFVEADSNFGHFLNKIKANNEEEALGKGYKQINSYLNNLPDDCVTKLARKSVIAIEL